MTEMYFDRSLEKFPIAEESNDDITENSHTGYRYYHEEYKYQHDDLIDEGTDEDNVYRFQVKKTLCGTSSHLYVSHSTPVLNSMELDFIGRKVLIEGHRTVDVKISDMEEKFSKMKSYVKKMIDSFFKDVEAHLRIFSAVVPSFF